MSIKTSTQYVCLVITLSPLRAGIKHNCDPDWPNSHQGSDWPWLHNVSTSQTPVKGEDYRGSLANWDKFSNKKTAAGTVDTLLVTH